MLSRRNGPGDPAAMRGYAVPAVRAVVDAGVPVFGICLGHALLGAGPRRETRKWRRDVVGANHPVKDFTTGKVEIVSMNHGFTVDRGTLPESCGGNTHSPVRWHRLRHSHQGAAGVLGAVLPEASPGRHDSFISSAVSSIICMRPGKCHRFLSKPVGLLPSRELETGDRFCAVTKSRLAIEAISRIMGQPSQEVGHHDHRSVPIDVCDTAYSAYSGCGRIRVCCGTCRSWCAESLRAGLRSFWLCPPILTSGAVLCSRIRPPRSRISSASRR